MPTYRYAVTLESMAFSSASAFNRQLRDGIIVTARTDIAKARILSMSALSSTRGLSCLILAMKSSVVSATECENGAGEGDLSLAPRGAAPMAHMAYIEHIHDTDGLSPLLVGGVGFALCSSLIENCVRAVSYQAYVSSMRCKSLSSGYSQYIQCTCSRYRLT